MLGFRFYPASTYIAPHKKIHILQTERRNYTVYILTGAEPPSSGNICPAGKKEGFLRTRLKMTQVSWFNGGWGRSDQGKRRSEGQGRNIEKNRKTGIYWVFPCKIRATILCKSMLQRVVVFYENTKIPLKLLIADEQNEINLSKEVVLSFTLILDASSENIFSAYEVLPLAHTT